MRESRFLNNALYINANWYNKHFYNWISCKSIPVKKKYHNRQAMETYSKKPTLYDRGTPKGKIKLTVSGLKDQQILSLDDVTQAIDALPSRHLNGINELRFQEDHTYVNEYGEEVLTTPKSTKGVFVQQDRIILMHHFDDIAEFKHILYHEIGHHVFYRIITGTQRHHWVTRIHPDSFVITRYAGRNASEDFAESYACFLLDPKQLLNLPEKYRFLRDDIFGGVSVNLEQQHVDLSI